jgi:hypothetical protein
MKLCSNNIFFEKEKIFLLNFNLKALFVIVLRFVLNKKTVISIHDVDAHPGIKSKVIELANRIAFFVSKEIVVYSKYSFDRIIKKYNCEKKSIHILPLEVFWYNYD